jgi:hypothetical protein
MGNAQSVGADIEDKDYKIRPPIDSETPGHTKTDIRVALLCQQNSQDAALHGTPIADVKGVITRFLKDVYVTNASTVIHWTTWDVEDADIVLSRDAHLRESDTPIFDVVVELHCYLPQSPRMFPSEDFKAVCRLLKPQGLLLVPRPAAGLQKILETRPGDFSCGEGREMVPIFAIPVREDYLRRDCPQSNHFFAEGLTVFQKL